MWLGKKSLTICGPQAKEIITISYISALVERYPSYVRDKRVPGSNPAVALLRNLGNKFFYSSKLFYSKMFLLIFFCFVTHFSFL